MSQADQFVRSVPLFAELPPAAIATIARCSRRHAFEAGQLVFIEGEPCTDVYVLREGRVKGYVANAEGREQIMRIFDRPGDAFCLTSAFSAGRYVVSASALTPTTIYVLDTAVIAGIARNEGSFALKLVTIAGGETATVLKVAEDLALRTATCRLAKVLHQFGLAEGHRRGDALELDRRRLKEDELAARIGAVRVHVSRSLKALARAGAIELNRKTVVIPDPAALNLLAEATEPSPRQKLEPRPAPHPRSA